MDKSLDPEELRAAMRAWTVGVTIVTAAHQGEQHGMTVNSFTSVSLDPPLVIISLQNDTRTCALVRRAEAFGVTVLSSLQADLSDLFAGRLLNSEERMSSVETETLVTGAPLIKGGLAYFDCRVRQSLPAGVNTLFLAEVVAARSYGEDHPLVYHNREYRRLAE